MFLFAFFENIEKLLYTYIGVLLQIEKMQITVRFLLKKCIFFLIFP